jgi:hypothetical protein
MKKGDVLLFIVVVAALLIAGVVIGKSCKNKKPQNLVVISEIKAMPVVHTKDPGGTDHAQKQVAIGDVDAMRVAFVKQIDSLAKLLKVKPKTIDRYLAIGTETTGELTSNNTAADYADYSKPCEDSLTWQDDFTKIEASKEDGKWKMKYKVKDSLNFIAYWKGRKLMLNGFSYNPNTIITGLNEIQVPGQKQKRWGLGINVSCIYQGGKFKPSIGAGLQYNLIRF